MHQRVTCGWTSPLPIRGQWRCVRDEWFHIINYCLLLLPLFFSAPCSPAPSNLQPPLLFWQLFLMPTEPPTNGILFLHCGFFIPCRPHLLFSSPSLPFPFCTFILYDERRRVSGPEQCVRTTKLERAHSSDWVCVCVCVLYV